MFDQRRWIILFLFSATMIASRISPGQATSQQRRDSNVIEELNFKLINDVIVIDIQINDRTFPFLLDTGSSHHIFDRSLKTLLGSLLGEAPAKTPNGTIQAQYFEAPQAFLGSLDIRTTEPVVCLDLTPLRNASKIPFYGLIGMSFLKDHIIRFDFEKSKLAFLKISEPSPNRTSISFAKNKVPSIDIEIPHLGKRQFILDTGHNLGLTLKSDDFSELQDLKAIVLSGSMRTTDAANTYRIKIGIINTISISNKSLCSVSVAECLTPDVRVGLKLLSKFQCTFDFPHSTLYLQEIQ